MNEIPHSRLNTAVLYRVFCKLAAPLNSRVAVRRSENEQVRAAALTEFHVIALSLCKYFNILNSL